MRCYRKSEKHRKYRNQRLTKKIMFLSQRLNWLTLPPCKRSQWWTLLHRRRNQNRQLGSGLEADLKVQEALSNQELSRLEVLLNRVQNQLEAQFQAAITLLQHRFPNIGLVQTQQLQNLQTQQPKQLQTKQLQLLYYLKNLYRQKTLTSHLRYRHYNLS